MYILKINSYHVALRSEVITKGEEQVSGTKANP